MTPIQAIEAKCRDCVCGDDKAVKYCGISDCALFPFRLGHNPNIAKRIYSPEQRAAMAERMQKARDAKKGKSV